LVDRLRLRLLTIVENLEKYLDEVGYAFAILTPDDMGCLGKQFMNFHSESIFKNGESEADKNKKARFFFREVPKLLMNRARQNVMLEFGCCIAKLGRERVCCLNKREVELPSDMNGILHIRFKESLNEVRDKIVKELKAAGYQIKI